MALLYLNDKILMLVLSTKKQITSFFEKGFSFPENLFQSQSIENVQNVYWLSHKNMPVSQTEGFFENP